MLGRIFAFVVRPKTSSEHVLEIFLQVLVPLSLLAPSYLRDLYSDYSLYFCHKLGY
jgi:hypothetical protein